MSREHKRGVWARARQHALRRDNWTCQKCGGYGRMEVHHLKAVKDGGTHEIDNLQTLCNTCHIELHRKGARPRYKAGWEEWIKELA